MGAFANLDFRIDCRHSFCHYSDWRKAEKGQVVICCQEFQNPFRNLKDARSYSPIGSIVRPAELHSRSAEENCQTENVSSLCSVKGTALPCGLAVRKQHKMLFAASKFENEKLELDERSVIA